MSPITQSIIEGKEQPDIIIVQDEVNQNGRGLIKCLVSHLITRVEHIHVILNDIHSQYLTNELQPAQINRITIHYGTSNPLGWENQSENDKIISVETDLVQYIKSSLGDISREQKIGVVIDSLSNLLLHKGISPVCQLLQALSHLQHGSAEILQVIALVHGDLHDDTTLAMLHHSCNCLLKVEPASHLQFHLSCRTLQKRTSGKVVKSHDHIKFGKNWSLLACEEIVKLVKLDTAATSAEELDPTANLTFNLSLSDKEKQDRSNLVLPYIRSNRKQESDSEGGGKIFYQPDDADDFDEEDPDDDLDI